MGPPNALDLHARFALMPNIKGLCGDISDQKILLSCIQDQTKCNEVRDLIPKFRTLKAMIGTIAECTDQDLYSYKVASAYWMGGNLLAKFLHKKPEDCIKILMKNLRTEGVPEDQIKILSDAAPKDGFIPLHLYMILLNARVNQNFNLIEINECMVRWGQIKEFTSKEKAMAELHTLVIPRKDRLSLQLVKDAVIFDTRVTPSLKRNDLVAVHHGLCCKIPNRFNLNGLFNYTKRVIDLFNKG